MAPSEAFGQVMIPGRLRGTARLGEREVADVSLASSAPRARPRVGANWVDDDTAAELRRRAEAEGRSLSWLVVEEVTAADLPALAMPTEPHRVTLGCFVTRALNDRVDEAAFLLGLTRSELLAAALASSLRVG